MSWLYLPRSDHSPHRLIHILLTAVFNIVMAFLTCQHYLLQFPLTIDVSAFLAMSKGQEVISEASRVGQFTRRYPSCLKAGNERLANLFPRFDLLTSGINALLLFLSFLRLRKEEHGFLSTRSWLRHRERRALGQGRR